jgi:hypothetical protein
VVYDSKNDVEVIPTISVVVPPVQRHRW